MALALATVKAQIEPTQDDYLVKDLPDLSAEDAAKFKQYAGSSADGYFLESGPLRFIDGKLTVNEGGWHEFANVVFLDQPIGTGLSYSSEQLLENMGQLSTHFLLFLQEFYRIFPERAQDDIYLAGESYAGTYIPYFSKAVLDHNENLPPGHAAYNLKGAVIGNGWIDPLHQDELSAKMDLCLDDIRMRDRITQSRCEGLVEIVLQGSTNGLPDAECTNQYDIRLKDTFPSCGLKWPTELPQMKSYLSRQDVRAALHASAVKDDWTECSSRVGSALRYDDSIPSVSLLPNLLEKIKVLLFSGDQDLICNHIGTEYLISNMTWCGAQGFQDAPEVAWEVAEKPAGYWRQARNMTYVLIYNASHMVPYDAPLQSLDMINRFMGLDPTLQSFASKLGLDLVDEKVPPSGEVVEIEQPKANGPSSNGSAALLLVIISVGLCIFVIMRNNSRQKKLGGGSDGVQWFPLDGRSPVHTDELDELVVESGIRESEDDDDNDGNSINIRRSNSPLGYRD
ncbi:Cell death protease [Lunasporangiospora selenospora]|uniref:Carboxypeptidase n=1 Tax=Lunasporangiospora selenospora TaxID=979761 RepID=A0A9P6G0U3_9FUNG|nr:Cell death protease [Lunasporangiospora selenospora]